MSDEQSIRRSARQRAAKVLVACYDGEHRGLDLLDAMQQEEPLSAADAGLAAELVMGVLRHRITCEHIAAHFYRGRWEGLRPSLRVILALGVYQLCWLERIPDHAAVDQAVRMARTHGRGAMGTVNAILRKVAAVRGELVDRPVAPMPRRYLPVDACRGRLFSEDMFPDPARRPLDYLVAATGHPMWLVERWHRRFKPKLCRQICDAGARRPDLVLRANTMRITPGALLERLNASGHAASFVEGTNAIVMRDHPAVGQLPEFVEGLCQPQDSTAQLAVRMAAPKPGEIVLDLCAGVGTKATQAAEMMSATGGSAGSGNDAGVVLATDIDEQRLALARENAARLGVTSLRTVGLGALDAALAGLPRPPDVILVDAPCTNTGVLARRPEARYRASQKSLTALVALQREVLAHAARLAGPNTRIVYATCSLEREENEEQVVWFSAQFDGWKVVDQRLTLPDRDRDGGFAAVIRRDQRRKCQLE